MKTCLICRENHEERVLSFDGKGINACGIYRTRLATFTSGCDDDQVTMLGPLFAAAPDLLAALQGMIDTLDESEVIDHDFHGHDNDGTCQLCNARTAIAKAMGEA